MVDFRKVILSWRNSYAAIPLIMRWLCAFSRKTKSGTAFIRQASSISRFVWDWPDSHASLLERLYM